MVASRGSGLSPEPEVPPPESEPGPLPEPEPAERDACRNDAVLASAAEHETAAALVSGIADEKLRNLVARAAAASLARARATRPV
jgi:hypothetical protein